MVYEDKGFLSKELCFPIEKTQMLVQNHISLQIMRDSKCIGKNNNVQVLH